MPNSRQHVNTASPDVNTGSSKLNIVDPSFNIASSYDQDSPKDMFTIGASHTLEATYVEFFSDEDEPKVDLGNIINSYIVPTTPNIRIHKDHPIKNVIGDVKSSVQTKRMTKPISEQGFLSAIESTSITKALSDSSWVEVMQEELLQFKLQQVWILVDLPIGKRAIGTKWVFRNKKDERGIVIRNKASAFLYGTIEEEVYVTQPPGFKDPDHLDKVYNVVKVYVDDIIFGSTNKELCIRFEKLMKENQDKYVAEILKKFNYTDVKSASTPVDLEKPLVKDGDADDVDIHICRSMIGSLMYLKASRPDIMFAVRACARFQVTPKTSHLLACKKQTVVATSTTEAEYVAATSCCRQVLWIQNQLLDYRHVKRGRDTKIPQSSGPPVKVGDEAVHKELGDRMERAATTTSSLEAEQDSDAQTRFETTSKQSNDPPLSRGYTLGSGEHSLKLLELMELCTKMSNKLHKNRKSDLFWATAKAKTVNGERQIQALIDKKKVIITETSIRSDLHLEDAGGTDCLPTATIFEELARMGYEKPSQKLTFYKAFFSPQWKFLIHTITQCLSAKSTEWNEFSSTMASLIICLATNQKFNLSKYIFDAMVKHLDGGVKFLMYLRFLQVFINQQLGDMSHHKKIYVNPSHTKKIFANMKKEGKDFSGRVTPLFATMMVQANQEEGVDLGIPTDSNQTPITTQPSSSRSQKKQSRKKQRKDTTVTQEETQQDDSVPTPSNDPPLSEKAKDAQAKEITELKKMVQKLERKKKSRPTGLKRLRKVGMYRRVESSKDKDSLGDHEDASKQGSSIEDIDKDVDICQLVKNKTAKPKVVTTAATTTTTIRLKARGVVVQEPSEFRTPQESQPLMIKNKGKAIMMEPEVPLKRIDQVALDEDLARNLQAQLEAKLIEEERLTRKKEEEANIALIESWDNTQPMMEADFELARIDQGLGSTSGIRACALRNFDLEVMEFENTQNNALAKLPMLKLGEYEMWEIRIK
ncbi:hypothetical protein Tco_1081914 [Tanacetum coccineum]|uniref:Reverse transcriptase Ty1/copia-type domain-containing protein n=1 Tax=Tanacetum coccineum TaxID=301880 RepID=A0ABQ5HZ02_9ASTR